MDAAKLKASFRSLTAAGFPETATDEGGNTFTGTVTGMRADFAASLYGMGSGYKLSFLTEYSETLPARDGILTLRGKKWAVLGMENFHGISVRLDLKEGF